MKSLARLVKQEICQHATFVHCFAHCNELVFKDATSHSPLVSDSQDLSEDLYALVGVSPTRVLLFEKIQEEFNSNRVQIRLKNLSRTR